MYNDLSSSPTLTNCILWGNTASSNGNEIYNDSSSCNPRIDTCIIQNGKSGIYPFFKTPVHNWRFEKRIQIPTNKKRMYKEQSHELCNFLEEKITKENYNEIIDIGGISFTVETASVPPYIIKIDISSEYENNVRYEDFFSDILDAIVEVYKSNKIKV